MKIKNKQTKIAPGISRTTQKTFIATALIAYLSHTAILLQSILSMPSFMESFAHWTPVYLVDTILSPLLLFMFAYFVLNNKTSKVSRVFKAMFVAMIGVIVSFAVNILFMELFREPLGYGSAVAMWTAPWIRWIPAVIALSITIGLVLFVFKSVKTKEFTSSRKVQKIFIGLIAFAVGVNMLTAWYAIFNGSNGGYSGFNEAMMAFVSSALIMFVPMAFLYFIASKTQTKLTRLFNALLYLLILAFISSIIFSAMTLLGIYMHEPGSIGALLQPVLTLTAIAAILAIHKLNHAF